MSRKLLTSFAMNLYSTNGRNWVWKELWWKFKCSSYKYLKEKIVWENRTSENYSIYQCSHQGAYPSTDDYISYIYNALNIISSSNLGVSIGPYDVTVPTCADDMILMSTCPIQLQCLINIITEYANQERYRLHPRKSYHLISNQRTTSKT